MKRLVKKYCVALNRGPLMTLTGNLTPSEPQLMILVLTVTLALQLGKVRSEAVPHLDL